MGFQDNSGDIILDAVLTDEGRRRLARGDGGFSITKFALGDEEINYGLYDITATTAYQDLAILQTPILEAFTNNTSTMKTKLVTLTDNNTFYLPVLKLNEKGLAGTAMHSDGHYVIAVDGNTEDNNNADSITTAIGGGAAASGPIAGIIWGAKITTPSTHIRVDAGLDTNQIPPSTPIESYAAETAYIVEMDNRLGYIVSPDGALQKSPDAIDDDNIATYSFTSTGGGKITNAFVSNNSNTSVSSDQVIAGPRSTKIHFKIASAANLRQSNYLFTLLGGTDTMDSPSNPGDAQPVKYIDSIVKVTGLTTGYSVDIPVRYVKV
jgi:hypothetical protein